RRLRAVRVPQSRRLGPAGHPRRLLLRDGRPPQQQLRQPPLGHGAEEVHHRQGAAAVVASAVGTRVLIARPTATLPAAAISMPAIVCIDVLLLNLAVALAKIGFGYASGATSILSDGFHSLTDAASNVAGLVGVQAAGQPPDADHPYGHRKYETVAAASVIVFLLLVVVEV